MAPAVVHGVVYRALDADNADQPASFVAASARTGARLWHVTLPNSQYIRGQSVVGDIAVLPFEGRRTLGGVTAVDLSTHKVIWSRSRPASTRDPGNDDGTGGPIVVDAGRVFLLAGNNDLSAYSLTTGTLLWHRDPAAGVKGIAAAGGVLYTGDYPGGGGPGLVAYRGSSGARLWTAAGLTGQPAVVGSHVLAQTGDGVGSVAARGCGAPTCRLSWSRPLDAESDTLFIGAATADTFYVAYEPLSNDTGRLVRIGTAHGVVQWTYRAPRPFGEFPIRAGDTVWLQTDTDTVSGWSVDTHSATPLTTITLPSADDGVVGGLAAADGALLVDIFAGDLTAYRIPGR